MWEQSYNKWREYSFREKKIAESKKVEQKMNAVDFSGSTASDDVPDEKVEQKKLVEEIKSKSGNDFGWAID